MEVLDRVGVLRRIRDEFVVAAGDLAGGLAGGLADDSHLMTSTAGERRVGPKRGRVRLLLG